MHRLQNYGAEEAVYDGNAYSFTSTYHDGQLKVYTTHPTAPKAADRQAEYHMTQMRSFAMTDTPARLREGAAAYRNLRDLVMTHRDSFVDQANDHVSQLPAESPSTSLISSSASVSVALEEGESDTSVDELALSALRRKDEEIQ